MHLLAAPYGRGDRALPFFLAGARCNRLGAYYWIHAATAALYLQRPEEALSVIEKGMSLTDAPQVWMDDTQVLALLALGRVEAARVSMARIQDTPPATARRRVAFHAAAGEADAARRELDRWRSADPLTDADRVRTAALLGHRDEANEAAGRIDARPLGPTRLAIEIYLCGCGAPFDLEVAPHLARRLEEAGLSWPPLAIMEYPLKEW
jgi:hypothetical protein